MVSPSPPISTFFKSDEINDSLSNTAENTKRAVTENNHKIKLAWFNIAYFIILHIGASIGIYLAFTSTKMATNLFTLLLYVASGMGITAGAHRLWSHRTYKATWQLKLILVFFNTMTNEGHILAWARDHRVHHKYSDTLADPYSAGRGFFFAHCGWLFCRKHPAVIEKGKSIDLSDLYADPIVKFQKEYYWPLMISVSYLFPIAISVCCWNESLINAIFVPVMLRIALALHGTFIVNSVAHFYGYKPYDRNIQPVDNSIVSFFAVGEGSHNYHHVFPWDYKASEFGTSILNPTNAFIHFFARIGWAYDLKTVCPDVIRKRVQRTGDGSHELWGWGDKDITKDDKDATIITYRNNLKYYMIDSN